MCVCVSFHRLHSTPYPQPPASSWRRREIEGMRATALAVRVRRVALALLVISGHAEAQPLAPPQPPFSPPTPPLPVPPPPSQPPQSLPSPSPSFYCQEQLTASGSSPQLAIMLETSPPDTTPIAEVWKAIGCVGEHPIEPRPGFHVDLTPRRFRATASLAVRHVNEHDGSIVPALAELEPGFGVRPLYLQTQSTADSGIRRSALRSQP